MPARDVEGEGVGYLSTSIPAAVSAVAAAAVASVLASARRPLPSPSYSPWPSPSASDGEEETHPSASIPAATSAVAAAAVASVLARRCLPWHAREPRSPDSCPSPSYSPWPSPPSSNGGEETHLSSGIPAAVSAVAAAAVASVLARRCLPWHARDPRSPNSCPSPSYSPDLSPPSSDDEEATPGYLSGLRRGFLLPPIAASGGGGPSSSAGPAGVPPPPLIPTPSPMPLFSSFAPCRPRVRHPSIPPPVPAAIDLSLYPFYPMVTMDVLAPRYPQFCVPCVPGAHRSLSPPSPSSPSPPSFPSPPSPRPYRPCVMAYRPPGAGFRRKSHPPAGQLPVREPLPE